MVEKGERDFLKFLSLVLFKFNSLSSGLSSFPSKNSQRSVSLACESLLSVFTHTQVVRTIATRRKQIHGVRERERAFRVESKERRERVE